MHVCKSNKKQCSSCSRNGLSQEKNEKYSPQNTQEPHTANNE